MEAEHKIKREILRRAERYSPDEFSFGELESAEAIDEAWTKLDETGLRHEHEAEFRGGQCETDIPAPWSRHYESKSVAAKLEDGSLSYARLRSRTSLIRRLNLDDTTNHPARGDEV